MTWSNEHKTTIEKNDSNVTMPKKKFFPKYFYYEYISYLVFRKQCSLIILIIYV